MSVCGPIMAGNGLQQSRQPGYIQAELYLLAAGFLCANSADNTLRLLMATLKNESSYSFGLGSGAQRLTD